MRPFPAVLLVLACACARHQAAGSADTAGVPPSGLLVGTAQRSSDMNAAEGILALSMSLPAESLADRALLLVAAEGVVPLRLVGPAGNELLARVASGDPYGGFVLATAAPQSARWTPVEAGRVTLADGPPRTLVFSDSAGAPLTLPLVGWAADPDVPYEVVAAHHLDLEPAGVRLLFVQWVPDTLCALACCELRYTLARVEPGQLAAVEKWMSLCDM